MSLSEPTLSRRCLAEVVGTFLLVFFGCGAVHVHVLTGALVGLWQVAIVWGVAIMVAISTVGNISGAHINPAITMAFWAWRGFPGRWVGPYLASQLGGAVLAAASLLVLFGSFLEEKEKKLGLTRGQPGSEMTAMCYGEYFPNPGRMEKDWTRNQSFPDRRADLRTDHYQLFSEGQAFFAEFLGTLLLGLVVFAVTDENNSAGRLAPVLIGLTVAILISVIAPLTQACFNPARDFGPRLVAFYAGWGEIALPGPNARGIFTVYLLAPLTGGIAGGGLYTALLRPGPPSKANPT